MGSSDAELRALMAASLGGDSGAYRALLGDLRLRLQGFFLRRVARTGDAEDLVQETLIAIHGRRATYDADQPFLPWAYAIARYKLIDYYRRHGRRVSVPIEDHEGELSVPDESAAIHARADVERALAILPPKVRAILEDHKLRELSVAETAVRAGMTETAVKVAVHRGIKLMGSRMNGKGSDA